MTRPVPHCSGAAASSPAAIADLAQLRGLLTVPTVEARLAAVTRLPDDALTDAELESLLADRSTRVREQARRRAGRRGTDVARWYRSRIGAPGVPERVIRDPGLASLGLTGVSDWLLTSAATTWAPLSEAQRGRVSSLLSIGPLDAGTSSKVAFHAGLPHHPPPAPVHPDDSVPSRSRRLHRLVRRGR